ncbi:MAG: DUF3237 domain-containing protein [Firmicutes bacterium]|nr:DUF3237 domain-containing protein [Bacillota bacterium]
MKLVDYQLPLPGFEKLFRAQVLLGDTYPLGEIGSGYQEIVAITGGSFEGVINGQIMNLGADWGLLYNETVNELNTRYLLKTDDGAFISVECGGKLIMSMEDMMREDGTQTGDADYYFRQTVKLTAGAEQYRWLNEIVAIGVSAIIAGGNLCLDVYKLT